MTQYGQVAVAFASALVAGNFIQAQELLAPALREELTPEQLREHLYEMFSGYADGDSTTIYYNEEFSMEDWPDKLPGDIGWAYVGIAGDDFLEAVTMIVANVDGKLLIRDVEWGRP